MVISDEIKFPRPIRIDRFRTERKVDPIEGAAAVTRIMAFKRDWQRSREERGHKKEESLAPQDESNIRHLIEEVNIHLANRQILLHLLLVKNETGYAIDVYDCTAFDRCAVVGDVALDPRDLADLLRTLQRETGILFDGVL